jgi:hypothetical protein
MDYAHDESADGLEDGLDLKDVSWKGLRHGRPTQETTAPILIEFEVDGLDLVCVLVGSWEPGLLRISNGTDVLCGNGMRYLRKRQGIPLEMDWDGIDGTGCCLEVDEVERRERLYLEKAG